MEKQFVTISKKRGTSPMEDHIEKCQGQSRGRRNKGSMGRNLDCGFYGKGNAR